MDLPWAMVPSTSNIGWMGKLLQWVWSISCRPVYLLSTCSTTQILLHCRWAPTLLSGQPSYPFSGIEKQLMMNVDLIFRVCSVLKPWKKLFKDFAKMQYDQLYEIYKCKIQDVIAAVLTTSRLPVFIMNLSWWWLFIPFTSLHAYGLVGIYAWSNLWQICCKH